MTKAISATLLVWGLTASSTVAAFVGNGPSSASLLTKSKTSCSSTQLFDTPDHKEDNHQSSSGNLVSSRKDFFQTIRFSAGLTASSLWFPISDVANAAEDVLGSDDAISASVSGILQSSNLRSLKRAEKQLSKLEFYAVENDYENMKLAIRNAPFSEVRKNSFALIKEFSQQPAEQEKLTASYEIFISSLEKMDSTASLGMRGRKLEKDALLQAYQATASSFSDWIQVVTEVAQGS